MPQLPLHHRQLAALQQRNVALNNGFWRTAAAVLTVGASEVGISAGADPRGSKVKHAEAVKKQTLYRNKFLECKQKQLNKGNPVVPEDPNGKCKRAWKRWQKWRGKAGEEAIKVLEKAEKRGRLDPIAEQFLLADQARSMADPMAAVDAAAGLPPAEQDAYLSETLTVDSGLPWGWLAGGAVVGTLGLIFLLRRGRTKGTTP